METLKNLSGKNYFQDSFYKFLNLKVDQSHQSCYEKVKVFLTGKMYRSLQDTLVGITETIEIINDREGEDFLQSFIRPGPGSIINQETITAYKNLKSLLIGLLFCHSITNNTELQCYKEQWQKYALAKDEDYLLLGDHQLIYEKFVEVKTMDDLQDFKSKFRTFIANKLMDYAKETDYLVEQSLLKLADYEGLQSFRNLLSELHADYVKKISLLKDKTSITL